MGSELALTVHGVAVSCDRAVFAEWLEQFARESARRGMSTEEPARLCHDWFPLTAFGNMVFWSFHFPESLLECRYSESRVQAVCETVERTWRRLRDGGGGDLLCEANLLRVGPEEVLELACALRESLALGAPSPRFVLF